MCEATHIAEQRKMWRKVGRLRGREPEKGRGREGARERKRGQERGRERDGGGGPLLLLTPDTGAVNGVCVCKDGMTFALHPLVAGRLNCGAGCTSRTARCPAGS